MDPKKKMRKGTGPQLSLETFRKLPKADLHRHLDGSVRIGTIIELAKEQGVDLPTFDEAELAKHICVDQKECLSLVDYLVGFDITLKVMQKAYAITRIMYEVCEDAVADGVTYLEVRFSPILHTAEGLALSEVMEAICEGQFMAMVNLPIHATIIVSGMRQLPPTETERLAEITWRYRRKGVGGFDLAGPEDGFSSYNHRSAFDIVRKKGINCTLHSGEAAGADSIKDSIMYCGAHRIGHGVRLREDPKLLDFVVSRRIALEVCVTSNEQTKAVDKAEDHPIREFFDRGVVVVPCTDNTTVSHVTLSEEYFRIQKLFGFDVYSFVKMLDWGFMSAFVDNTLKARLRAEALKSTFEILKAEGHDVSGVIRHAQEREFDVGVNLLDLAPPYWKQHINPEITEEIIRMIPKTDLHCRLCGSVSLELVWKEASMAGIDLSTLSGMRITSPEELRVAIQGKHHSPDVIHRSKLVFYEVLQTRDQIRRGVEDILTHAFDDGVVYMDLMVRPVAHTKKGLSAEDVLDVVLEECQTMSTRIGMRTGVVVFASPVKDDPIAFLELAKLAVANRERGVTGFGVYGEDDMPSRAYPYFTSTFDYLKGNHMNTGMGAGKSDVGSIIDAIHSGGAARLSGAFQVHRFPRLMTYLANHRIPLELRMSDKFDDAAGDVSSFIGDSPIRLYLDNGLLVTPCSFALSLYPTTRSQFILDIVHECRFNIAETLKFLGYGFQHNFLPYVARNETFEAWWIKTKAMLTERGFQHFFPQPYFTSHSTLNAGAGGAAGSMEQ